MNTPNNQRYSLDEWLNHEGTTVTIKKEAVENSKDATLRRFKDGAIFLLAVAAVTFMFIYSVSRLLNNPSDMWAMGALNTITAALVGYITGKKVK